MLNGEILDGKNIVEAVGLLQESDLAGGASVEGYYLVDNNNSVTTKDLGPEFKSCIFILWFETSGRFRINNKTGKVLRYVGMERVYITSIDFRDNWDKGTLDDGAYYYNSSADYQKYEIVGFFV